ncbi:hypothetical protein NHQ30_000264 [Ciborinia camelliae]|nr:hypothetical protein NHQ30_000264 [Ciborinia camelliae]
MLPTFTPNLVVSKLFALRAEATAGKYVQHMPVSPSTPITTMGDAKKNIGRYVLAILKQLSLTLPSKYVLAATETITAGGMLNLWPKVTGKPALYLQTSLEDYDRLWPKWGKEVALMLQLWEVAKEKSWAMNDLLTCDDFGMKDRLVGMEAVFRDLDWSTL